MLDTGDRGLGERSLVASGGPTPALALEAPSLRGMGVGVVSAGFRGAEAGEDSGLALEDLGSIEIRGYLYGRGAAEGGREEGREGGCVVPLFEISSSISTYSSESHVGLVPGGRGGEGRGGEGRGGEGDVHKCTHTF